MVDNIADADMLELAIKNNKLIFLDFWAEWCGPCKSFSPIFENFAKENSDVKCLKINIDQHQDVAVKYEIKSIPTVAIIKDGKVVEKHIGMLNKSSLQEKKEKFNN